MSQFSVRALNPDNKLEINQLVDLFYRVHDSGYPINKVYDSKFWGAHLGSRFTSLAVFKKHDMVAHVALRSEPDDPKTVRIDYAIFDPSISSEISSLTSVLCDVVERQAKRQHWHVMYQFLFGSVPLHYRVPQKLTHSLEVALCPGYFPGPCKVEKAHSQIDKRPPCSRTNVLVAQRILTSRGSRLLHAPRRHKAIAKLLYDPLGIKREFNKQIQHCKNGDASGALEISSYGQTDITHAYICPSQVDWESALDSMKGISSTALIAFVDLTDPACPSFCDRMEDEGYRFCGVLPEIRGSDHILYRREVPCSFDTGHLYSPRARILEQYIQLYDRDQRSLEKVMREEYGGKIAVSF